MLEFIEKTHEYIYNGERIPSVSEIIRFLSREVYGESDKKAMDTAANRGTRIHKATEEIDRKGTADVDGDILPYVNAYIQFLTDNDVSWEYIEQPILNDSGSVLYAGIFDRYGSINGKKVLVDIKSTAQIGTKHKTLYATQLTAYSKANYMLCDGELIKPDLELDALAVLQLKKDGTYKLIYMEPEDALLTSCLIMHEKTKTKKRKKVSK